MATVNNNHAYDENDIDYPYENNFIDIPWDDRSKSSKIGIIVLLLSMAAVIVVCVCNSFIMQFACKQHAKATKKYTDHIHCPLVNMKEREKYKFAARVHSISSNKLLCMGAVLSLTTVLVDEACVKNERVIVVVGKTIFPEPPCKKGFPVDDDAEVDLDNFGLVSKKLTMLTTKMSLVDCAKPILIGSTINWKSPAYIIGRPLTASGRGLTKQPVTVSGRGNCSLPAPLSSKVDTKYIICVKNFERCLVHAGDLLVQDGKLLGIAAFTVPRTGTTARINAYFADLTSSELALALESRILNTSEVSDVVFL